ncbi:DUF4142 domain-containing protein [Streptomyces sp. NPDC046831]|uniref:DUF4142 domain-containing protein n=1 Tax=Streptomyces sp. NPDC046831 TaxID=3154805 RepID=UPI0033F3EBD3
MRPRPPVPGRGVLSGTGIIVGGLAATLAALFFPLWSYADRSGPGVSADTLSSRSVATPYGPLSPQDRDFVTKVRLAGLWELPAGEQAQRKGTTRAVRTAGEHLVRGHTFLDERVRDVAARLGLGLPNEPTAQQRKWLAGLSAARGEEYDRTFANTLRLAHGRVFSLVAQVRVSTQNSLVRALADDANTTVLDHIEVLEATGFVDFAALARESAPSGGPSAAGPAGDPPATAGPGDVIPVAPSVSPSYPMPPAASSPPPSGP